MTLRDTLVIAATALTILMLGHEGAAGAPEDAPGGGAVRATGQQLGTKVTPNIADRTLGDLVLTLQYVVVTYTGSLEGTSLVLQSIVRDDVVAKKAYQTNTGTFYGTLNGSEPGSFSFVIHNVADRSGCPCPPGIVPIHGKFVVIDGTGSGGLEGICGGGTITSPTGVGSTYDHTYRFGKDCKAND